MTAFKKQILLGVILVILANILAFAFHRGLFSNIAWIVYGLLLRASGLPRADGRQKRTLGPPAGRCSVHPHRTCDLLCRFIKTPKPRECSKPHESCKIAAFCKQIRVLL